ncbi:ATP-dependent Clp protease proteolytic subunit-related protein 1, chloroplastic [Tanacetum coccineum]
MVCSCSIFGHAFVILVFHVFLSIWGTILLKPFHLAAQRGDVIAVKRILSEINEQMSTTIKGAEFDVEVAEIWAPIVNKANELGETVMHNYKNVPQYLYGLSPSQMNMSMTKDNFVRRQAESVTEDTISSSHNYLNHGGMWSSSGMNDRPSAKYSMSVSMYRGGGGAAVRPRSAPPYLPSLLLDARICYMGMPVR